MPAVVNNAHPSPDEVDLQHDQPVLEMVLEFLKTITLTLALMFWSAVRAFIPAQFLPKKDIRGQTAVVTGAGSGLGRLVALRLAKNGAKLALLDIDAANNEQTKRLIEKEIPGAVVRAYRCDLSDRFDVYKIMEEARADVGEVDIVVNNAGIVTGKKLLDCPDDLMVKTMEVNAMSHFWTIKATLPGMMARNQGHIVSIASAAGLAGSPGLADYCASKFAVVGFTESLQQELHNIKKDGIKTTLVCPYYINTGMFDGVTTKFSSVLPILKPDYVADRIIEALLTDQTVLMLPRFIYFGYYLKSFLPTEAAFVVGDYLGLSHGMDGFKGRHKSRQS